MARRDLSGWLVASGYWWSDKWISFRRVRRIGRLSVQRSSVARTRKGERDSDQWRVSHLKAHKIHDVVTQTFSTDTLTPSTVF